MTRLCIATALGFALSCQGITEAQIAGSPGSFREVLEIVGLGPDILRRINGENLAGDDWQLLAQLVSRLEQHHSDLKGSVLVKAVFSPETIGELMAISGMVEEVVEERPSPAANAKGMLLTKLYRCRVITDAGSVTVLSARVPRKWDLTKSLYEPVSLAGVLINAEEPLLLTTNVSWFPTSGVPSGQLLMASHGMDAGLWEEITQKTAFVTPEKGREAEAFYRALATLESVPAQKLTELILEQVSAARTSAEPEFAAAVAQQAEQGLSSVVPLFLKPDRCVGELVRLEGTARRAVRVEVDERENAELEHPIRQYYELELFTSDSQNYPIVCCVAKLPAEFPVGDAIRTGVRIEGVFFKLWRYQSRKLIESSGKMTTQQSRLTPVVLANDITWLKQAPVDRRWWEIAVGIFVFAVIMMGLARVVLSRRNDRGRRLPDLLPNRLGD